jgi:hypothetical protein
MGDEYEGAYSASTEETDRAPSSPLAADDFIQVTARCEGILKEKSRGLIKTWKEQYCRLYETNFNLYTSEKDANTGHHCHVWDLKSISQIVCSESSLTFKVHIDLGKEIRELQAKDLESFQRWRESFRSLVQVVNGDEEKGGGTGLHVPERERAKSTEKRRGSFLGGLFGWNKGAEEDKEQAHSISGPTNVKHLGYMDLAALGLDISNLPPDLKDVLKQAGVKKSHLKKPETASVILSALVDHSADEWQELKNEEGYTYYFNNVTQESSWNKPDCLKTPEELAQGVKLWQELTTPEGHVYYWNSVTNDTVWEKPEDFDAYVKPKPKPPPRKFEKPQRPPRPKHVDVEALSEQIVRASSPVPTSPKSPKPTLPPRPLSPKPTSKPPPIPPPISPRSTPSVPPPISPRSTPSIPPPISPRSTPSVPPPISPRATPSSLGPPPVSPRPKVQHAESETSTEIKIAVSPPQVPAHKKAKPPPPPLPPTTTSTTSSDTPLAPPLTDTPLAPPLTETPLAPPLSDSPLPPPLTDTPTKPPKEKSAPPPTSSPDDVFASIRQGVKLKPVRPDPPKPGNPGAPSSLSRQASLPKIQNMHKGSQSSLLASLKLAMVNIQNATHGADEEEDEHSKEEDDWSD